MTPSRAARRRSGREALDDLARYRRELSVETFLQSRDDQRKVLHALLIATQACIDEALAACRVRGRVSETYRSAFQALGETGTLPSLPAELILPLMDWASFRNILAHFYPVLDLQRVWQGLDLLDPLARFLDWCDAQDGT